MGFDKGCGVPGEEEWVCEGRASVGGAGGVRRGVLEVSGASVFLARSEALVRAPRRRIHLHQHVSVIHPLASSATPQNLGMTRWKKHTGQQLQHMTCN